MKVCFISPYAYPLFNEKCTITFGGAEVQTYLLAKELSKDHAFSVHMVTADFGQKKKEQYGGITLHKSFILRTTNTYDGFVSSVHQCFNGLKLLCVLFSINADIYIQRSAGAETGIIAFLCRLCNKKFIYMTASDIDCNGTYIANNKVRGTLYSYGIKHAHRILTQSAGHKKLLFDTSSLKSTVLSTACPLYPLSNQRKEYILWIGRLIDLKRPDYFLSLAEHFSSEHFLMIAPRSGDEKVYDNYIKKIKSFKNVEYRNRVPFSEVDRCFSKAKMLINTSSYEGFPNTFVQAWKCAVPVLSVGVNPDDVFDKHKVGYCTHTVEELCEKVARLLADQSLYQSLAKNCYDYACTNHNIDTIIKQFKEILNCRS
ncbi:MAG: glycosyltransferase [Candidatus Omnitrophica bacterium]|nr:glycosyltransferase [Candidatus Omnitrophota bacterium]